MSQLPGRDHDMDAARRRARVDASTGAAFEATVAAVGSTERDRVTGKAAAWLASLPAAVRRSRALPNTDAPDTTWELPASVLQDLQPGATLRMGHP